MEKSSVGISGIKRMVIHLFQRQLKLKKMKNEDYALHQYFIVCPSVFLIKKSKARVCGRLRTEDVDITTVQDVIDKELSRYLDTHCPQGGKTNNLIVLQSGGVEVLPAMSKKDHVYYRLYVPLWVFFYLTFLTTVVKAKKNGGNISKPQDFECGKA